MQTEMKILSPPLSDVPGVSHGFFTRIGGTSPSPFDRLNTGYLTGDSPARVDENLARVRFQIGVTRDALYTVRQVHKDTVVVVTDDADPAYLDRVTQTEADALYTRRAGVALGIRTADCVPVLFASSDGEAIAAAHAGWRGAVAGVVEATLDAFKVDGYAPQDIVVSVGPCISQRHFEVGPEVIDAAAVAVPLDGLVDHTRGPRPYFDLRGYVGRRLEARGVTVHHVDGCTVEDEARFFSYRRDAGKTGRQMSVIARCAPPNITADMFG